MIDAIQLLRQYQSTIAADLSTCDDEEAETWRAIDTACHKLNIAQALEHQPDAGEHMNRRLIRVQGLDITDGVTMIGVDKSSYPVKRGNCFSINSTVDVLTGEGEDDGRPVKFFRPEPIGELRVINFSYENLVKLMEMKLVELPIDMLLIERTRCAIINDHRIPHEWYDSRWCGVCCHESLLPIPQRLEIERDLAAGRRKEKVLDDGSKIITYEFDPVVHDLNEGWTEESKDTARLIHGQVNHLFKEKLKELDKSILKDLAEQQEKDEKGTDLQDED